MECVLCSPESDKILWENERFYIIDASTKDFPLFIRLIPKKHVKELGDLTDEEFEELFFLIRKLDKLVASELNPTKVNWASFGNMTPHLHWHLIARWSDDRYFPECPWGPITKSEYPLSQETRENECLRFKKILKDLI